MWCCRPCPRRFLSTPSARRATSSRLPQKTALTDFYPRPPRGGRRAVHRSDHGQQPISIHALREEGDERRRGAVKEGSYISIHALREEGDPQVAVHHQFPARISIHALREEGDDDRRGGRPGYFRISIHALREEGDLMS